MRRTTGLTSPLPILRFRVSAFRQALLSFRFDPSHDCIDDRKQPAMPRDGFPGGYFLWFGFKREQFAQNRSINFEFGFHKVDALFEIFRQRSAVDAQGFGYLDEYRSYGALEEMLITVAPEPRYESVGHAEPKVS